MRPADRKQPGSALTAIEVVLKTAAEPLHYLEITKRVLARRLWTSRGRTPEQTIKARLTVDIQKKGIASRFVRLERGVYGLKEGRSAALSPKPAKLRSSTRGARLVSGQQYRVLSIHGPWAWAIIFGGKDIENRSWSTPYRGTILIHASSRKLGGNALAEARGEIAEHSHRPLTKIPEELPRSQIIGMVDVIDCVTDHHSRWASLGSIHWVLTKPRHLTAPITGIDGKLNLWTWTCP